MQRDWFDGAARFDGSSTAAERCRQLAVRLGREIQAPETANGRACTIDLGADFPLNRSRLRLCLPDAGLAAADVLNRLGAPSEVTLIVGADAGQRQTLAQQAQTRGGLLVAPTGQEITALLLAEDPLDTLSRLIVRHVPATRISPYQTGAGVHKQSLFFGRGSLVAQIMGGNPANYLVVGGRPVGKSSLLKEIERRYRGDATVNCRYLVLSGRDAVARLAESLSLPADSDLAAVVEQMRSSTWPRALFLMDEADAFAEQDRQQSYATLQRVRALSEEGRASETLQRPAGTGPRPGAGRQPLFLPGAAATPVDRPDDTSLLLRQELRTA